MTRLHEQHEFIGEVLVAEKGNVIYEGAFGVADRSTGRPYTTETRSCLASLSKPITAAAIMMLAEQHRLTYDDPLSKFLPGFADPVGAADDSALVDTHVGHSGLSRAECRPSRCNERRHLDGLTESTETGVCAPGKSTDTVTVATCSWP